VIASLVELCSSQEFATLFSLWVLCGRVGRIMSDLMSPLLYQEGNLLYSFLFCFILCFLGEIATLLLLYMSSKRETYNDYQPLPEES